jgi:Carboxypeptidase regulatory-like domain
VARALPCRRLHTDRSDHYVTAAPPRATAPRFARLLTAFALLTAAGCGDDGSGFSITKKTRTSGGAVEPELTGPVVIAAAKTAYTAAPVAGAGSLSGTVSLSSPIAPAEPVPAGADSTVCGGTIPDSSVQQRGTGLGNVVVWLEGIRSGKPLPLEKRLELESDKCLLTPRVQAAVVGSAVNVLGHDPFRQHLRFLSAGDSAARAAVLLGKDEQVIPTELPARRPGLVIIRDADHAWPRAYLAVFDHPYFAVSKPDGSFTIDGVPPGKYTLAAWHERTGKTEQSVTVGSNTATKVTVALSGK